MTLSPQQRAAANRSAHKFAVGDLLTFKAATRSHYRKATRIITNVDSYGRPCVHYHGWADFVVRPDEIISVQSA